MTIWKNVLYFPNLVPDMCCINVFYIILICDHQLPLGKVTLLSPFMVCCIMETVVHIGAEHLS